MNGSDEPLVWPADAVEVAKVIEAWGLKGGIRVHPYAADPQALFSSRRWYLRPPEGPGPARALPGLLRIRQVREQGDTVVAHADELPDRTAAEALKGARVFVPRSSFPTPATDEYYWVDLIGLSVRNREQVELGTVVGLLDTGPHSVLRIQPPAADGPDAPERLIPFVSAYVDAVDLPARLIQVDWGLDY